MAVGSPDSHSLIPPHRQHEAAMQSARRASSSREQYDSAGHPFSTFYSHLSIAIERMKELIQEEEQDKAIPTRKLLNTSIPASHTTQTRPRSKSCGRPLSTTRGSHATELPHRCKKVKEMTYGERLWSRAGGSLGGLSTSSADPVLQELKASAEHLGETLMEKQFGSYRYIGMLSLQSHTDRYTDEWEGIEIFKRSKKLLRQQQQQSNSTPALPPPQHIPFSSPPSSTSRGKIAISSTRRASDEGSRLSLL